jgi:hypothetical protein
VREDVPPCLSSIFLEKFSLFSNLNIMKTISYGLVYVREHAHLYGK